MQVVRSSQIEDRLAQLGGASDRFVHRIETWDTPKKNVISFRVTDRVEDQPAERDGDDEIIELVPVKPVGGWCGYLDGAEFTSLPLHCRDCNRIGRIILH